MKLADINVEYVDHMGSDLSVVNAARVSFDKFHEEFKAGDEKLIRYLAKHDHWTPFGHTALSLRIKAPIFVARQAVKHQVGLVWNEVSRRYVDTEPEFYIPSKWHKRPDASIKQGSGEEIDYNEFDPSEVLYLHSADSLEVYEQLLKEGVAPEEARMVLPLNTMTEWIWTGNCASWARVINLRTDPHAQLAIQELAHKIKSITQQHFPISMEALTNDYK